MSEKGSKEKENSPSSSIKNVPDADANVATGAGDGHAIFSKVSFVDDNAAEMELDTGKGAGGEAEYGLSPPVPAGAEEEAPMSGVSSYELDSPPTSAKLSMGVAPRATANGPVINEFNDHFSLEMPTSRIRYREPGSAARVIESGDVQLFMEEVRHPDTNAQEVTIRQIDDSSEGLLVLRLVYALVTAFWTGFLFVFCLQILLFVFFDLAVQAGATTKQSANVTAFIGVIFSLPLYVYGLSLGLAIAGAFIWDTFKGHVLFRSFTLRRYSSVAVEWIFFTAFLGLPLTVLGCTLLSGSEDWWEYTLLLWFSCVGFFYFIFCLNVICYDVYTCWGLLKKYYDDDAGFFKTLRRGIMLRQRTTYSGTRRTSFLSYGTLSHSEESDKGGERNMIPDSRKERIPWLAKLTMRPKLARIGWYTALEEPQQVYTIDDARDFRPFVTSYSWSLEKVFCRPANSRYIAIVKGPGAITAAQMKSSVACSVIGTFLIFFLVLGWALGTLFILLAMIVVAFLSLQGTYKLFKASKKILIVRSDLKKTDDTAAGSALRDSLSTYYNRDVTVINAAASECVYLVQHTHRITKPSNRFCWQMFAIEITLLFVWPLLSLYIKASVSLGIFFLIVGFFSGISYYFDASLVLEATGNMDLIKGTTDRETWRKQSIADSIIANVTRGRSHSFWMGILGSVGLLFVALFLLTFSPESTESEGSTLHFLPEFEYAKQADSVRYPACQLSVELSGSSTRNMADFAFLAGVAYVVDNNITQFELDSWFGAGNVKATNHPDIVDQFMSEPQNADSNVFFKLITLDNFAYVTIRGTVTPWDLFTDAQLWSAAALFQTLRLFIPLGEAWTPIIHYLINAISVLESSSLNQVAFYRTTTAFVEKLQADKIYDGVAATGHSLGGGLAMITGAQALVPGIGLSGPNAMLSRESFAPPVSVENLDSKTFNIIPARDIVPRFDDRAQNFQQIRCLTTQSDIIGCHNSIRSLCEIIYNCGTGMRPALCECVFDFGYEEPTRKAGSTGNQTFAETCQALAELY